MKITFLMLIALLFTPALFAQDSKEAKKKKDKYEWLDGIVRDSSLEKYSTSGGSQTAGKINPDGTYSQTTNQSTWNHELETFIVEGAEYVYVVERKLSFRWDKNASLTVNAPIKYAIDKNRLHFIDDNGRKLNGRVVKRILKEKPNQ